MFFVQFQDATKQVVVASFSCPQDQAVYPHQGEVEDDDPRYQAFVAALPKEPFEDASQQPA
jgi:hypothetical protein